MLLYAYDLNGSSIFIDRARRQVDYKCIECGTLLRVRGGIHRRLHFYHVEPTVRCRHQQKGTIHLQVQRTILNQLPGGEGQLEYPFPTIRRIADVAWIPQKLLFEVQYSPISAEEVINRTADYRSIGWEIAWIFHDHRYNQSRLSAAEQALRSTPHYFTNINEKGEGVIYDQFDVHHRSGRSSLFSPLPLYLGIPPNKLEEIPSHWPLRLLSERRKQWPFSVCGDLFSLAREAPFSSYLLQAIAKEQQIYFKQIKEPFSLGKQLQFLFQLFVECLCR